MSTTFSNDRTRETTAPGAWSWSSAPLTFLRGAARLRRLWQEALQKRRELHGLAALDDRTLGDIGVTRSELGWRASQSFWNQPESLEEAPKPPAGSVIPLALARRASGVPAPR